MEDYTKFKNYTKIAKYSEVEIILTRSQKKLVNDLLIAIGELEIIFDNSTNGIKMDESVLLMNLINLEGQSSSLIEGTQTQFENLSYDIEGIDNIFQWETRNLLTLYKESIARIKNKTFFFSLDALREMHIKLYNSQSGKKYKVLFNTSKIIEKIKPGKLIENDEAPNWIGSNSPLLSREQNLDKATIIPVIPSQKINYLNDLLNDLNQKYQNQEILVEDIIKFHPIFEAIHPFSDGNGRLGRLLLTLLFKVAGIGKNILILFSDVILKNKDEYLAQLKKVQLTNNWNEWNSYFIKLLTEVKDVFRKKTQLISDLWNKYYQNPKINSTTTRVLILKYFFKYYKIHKSHTIKKIVNKNISQSTAYRDFEIVSTIIGATKENDYYVFKEISDIMTNE